MNVDKTILVIAGVLLVAELEAAAGGPPHLTFDDKKPPPASPAERWPAFLLRKWDEHRELMDAEIAGTGFWNLNRFVYSQVRVDSDWPVLQDLRLESVYFSCCVVRLDFDYKVEQKIPLNRFCLTKCSGMKFRLKMC